MGCINVTAASRMTEAELQESVRALCKDLGLLYYHAHDSRRSPAGFPDVVAVGPGGVLWAELKSQRGSLTAEQRRWGSRLTQAGERWYVLRPADLLDGTVRRLLLALAVADIDTERITG